MPKYYNRYNIISGDLSNAGYASSDIKKYLKTLLLPKHFIKLVCVASYEAEINIVIHSFGGHIDFYIEKNTIVMIFSDSGPGITNLYEAMKEGFSTAHNNARDHGFGAGLGLSNIKHVSDEMVLNSSCEGTILTVKFNMPKGEWIK